MKKATLLMVLAISLFSLNGCVGKAGTATMIGTALGGAAGGFLPSAFGSNVSPIVQTIAPIGGAILGGGIGYLIDSNNADNAEQTQVQQQQVQPVQGKPQYQMQQPNQMLQVQTPQQYQMRQQQQSMRQSNVQLTVPAVVVLGNNQGATVGNGTELSSMLMRIQPGAQFGMLVKSANVQALTRDMTGNGYMAIGTPRPYGQDVLLTFQKSSTKAAPTIMPLGQAARLL